MSNFNIGRVFHVTMICSDQTKDDTVLLNLTYSALIRIQMVNITLKYKTIKSVYIRHFWTDQTIDFF